MNHNIKSGYFVVYLIISIKESKAEKCFKAVFFCHSEIHYISTTWICEQGYVFSGYSSVVSFWFSLLWLMKQTEISRSVKDGIRSTVCRMHCQIYSYSYNLQRLFWKLLAEKLFGWSLFRTL